MKQEIDNLIKLSHQIGARLDYVQGGGGNISVKISDNLMAIKASGYELKNMTFQDGFAFVNYQEIAKKISELVIDKGDNEQIFSNIIKSFTKIIESCPSLRPSMETGFHSIIPFKYVIHSHAVYSNVLGCAKEGKKIMDRILPQARFVEYSNPGWQVTKAIFSALQKKQSSQIILLQNHGLIIAADDANEALELHENVNKKIQSELKLESCDINKINLLEQDFMRKNILFPDQIVYGLFDEIAKSEIGIHSFAAYSYILQAIKKSGLNPLFLQKNDVDFVANMESEKYRREVAIL